MREDTKDVLQQALNEGELKDHVLTLWFSLKEYSQVRNRSIKRDILE